MDKFIIVLSSVFNALFILSAVAFGISLAVKSLLIKTVKNIDKEIEDIRLEYNKYFWSNFEKAEQILMQNGGLNIPDIREGENSASQLYIYIQQKKAELEGKIITPDQVVVPFNLDFRMS